MTETMRSRTRQSEIWLRLFLTLVYFGLFFYLIKFVMGACLLFQAAMQICTGHTNPRLLLFTSDLNRFAFHALQYLTYTSDQRPFPFSDWPGPDDSAPSKVEA